MLLPQPAKAFEPVDSNEAAVAKDKLFDSQEDAYNRDKRELPLLLPEEKVIVQCEKNSLWDKIVSVMEIRPDKLSYLVDIEGKLLIRARFMLKPLEGGVSNFQVHDQDQGGAHPIEEKGPRRLER